MSIAAMNWAWRQQLTPTAKLVLMSLADAADDHGVCWPSVPTVARKCCVSSLTVRRIMQRLIARELLNAEARYRPDGSCSSNRHHLQLEESDLCHRPLSGPTPCPVLSDQVPLTLVSVREPPRELKWNHHHHDQQRRSRQGFPNLRKGVVRSSSHWNTPKACLRLRGQKH
jgi:Helix-turn-helix domain